MVEQRSPKPRVGGSSPSAPVCFKIMPRLKAADLKVELKKASWPTRPELLNSVVVVFVAIGLLGIFVSLADFSIYNVVDLLTQLVRGGK